MDKIKWTAIGVVLHMLVIASVQAELVVDTGTPNGSTLFFTNDRFAGEFTLAAETTITGIEHHMRVDTAGSVSMQIYSDGGNVPGGLLRQQSVFLSVGAKNWRGVSGLDWTLAAGTYWVAISPNFLPGFSYQGAPSGLGNEARTIGSNWFDVDSWNLGWRIEGTVVPIPATLPLFAAGIGLLGFNARRTRRG